MEYAIETDNLVKRFRNGFTALKGISIKVKKGDVVGYLGPNGAGKTTTIKILTKLIKPTSGKAFINGVDVTSSPKEVLKKVGALIEVPGIFEYLTPVELLTYLGKVNRIEKKDLDRRIKETLQLVKLNEWDNKKIGSFSTGMQRRLAVAKAVFNRPEVLLLDEPVLGLDPVGIRDIRDLIRKLQSEGMTVLLSSHLLGEVAEVCNSVIFLEKGTVLQSEEIGEIARRKESKTVKVELASPLSNEILKRIECLPSVHNLEVTENIIRIHFDGDSSISYQILRELVGLNLEIISYNPVSMGLEDYYISLMEHKDGS